MYLFRSEDKRQEAHKILDQKLQLANTSDYVLVNLDAPDRKEIIFPYAINAALQRVTKKELLQSIALLDGESHLDMEEEEFENEFEYLNYLEEVLIMSLEMTHYVDDIEAGYAEKFESVISTQGWKISSINRYGIFKTDPRYTDELLIKELKGHDGNNPNKFVGFSESTQKERLKEIRLECQHCLVHTPHWAEFIDRIFSDLESKKDKYRVIVDVYNPDSIIKAFYFTLIKGDSNYLPLFHLIVDYIDENKVEIYRGEIKSIGITPRLKLFTSPDGSGVYNEIINSMLIPDCEIDAFRMGLRYVISKTEIVDDKELPELFVEIDENAVVPDTSKYYSLEEYFMTNKSSIALMLKNYGRFAFHM